MQGEWFAITGTRTLALVCGDRTAENPTGLKTFFDCLLECRFRQKSCDRNKSQPAQGFTLFLQRDAELVNEVRATFRIAAFIVIRRRSGATSDQLARDMAVQCSPATVGLAKRVIYHFLGETDRAKAMVQETDLVWWTGTQPDIVAGVMAWMAGKDPQWKMPKHPDVPEELRFYE